MNKKIVILDDRYTHYQEETEVLKPLGITPEIVKSSNPDELARLCADADGIIVNLAPINAKVIAALNKCKIISRYGVGYDNVAVADATAKKIWSPMCPTTAPRTFPIRPFRFF